MLQAIRERAQGWIAWVIVGLISVPFALWGIQEYLGVGAEPVVAVVDRVEITDRDLSRRVQGAREELRQRLGSAYDPSAFEEGMLRSAVLDEMIQQAVLLETSRKIGMRVSDEEVRFQILSEPAFQSDGRFDRDTYERLLRLQGLSPAQFEAQQRQHLVGNQLMRALVRSDFVTTAEREQYRRLQDQTRELTYATVNPPAELDEEPVDEGDLQAFYAEHVARYQVPESVRLDYLLLDIAELSRLVEVSDEDLLAAYEGDQGRFGQAEQRHVRHILKTLPAEPDEATSAAALAELERLRGRILAGEEFTAIAIEHSQDPGSASQGGDLGTFSRGTMDAEFDRAAFELGLGEISAPVRTRFGYHLIEVVDILPAAVKPLEEVAETLREELARQQAEALYFDMGERLANAVYESADSLEPASLELGLPLRQSDWIGRDGGEGLFAHPRLIGAAFSDEVLINRANSDLIEPERGVLQAVVIRVAEHRPPTTLPLEEVREEVHEAIVLERAQRTALEEAEKIVEQRRAGLEWSALPAAPSALSAAAVGRASSDISTAIRDFAFTLPEPGDARVSVGHVELPEGGVAVVEVVAVHDGTPEQGVDPGDHPDSSFLASLAGRSSYQSLLGDLERRAKVERRAIENRTDF